MSSDPQQPAQTPSPRSSSSIAPAVIVGIVVATLFSLCACGGILLVAWQVAGYSAHKEVRRGMCMSNLKRIGMALQSYHDTHQSFPPAFVADAAGKPLYSWRVLILPHLEDANAQDIYAKFDPTKSWDSPENRATAERAPDVFRCPSSSAPESMTSYAAVVGEDTMWPGARAMTLGEITDGPIRTIAVVEADGAKINWLEPRDLILDEAAAEDDENSSPRGLQSEHRAGNNVLLADGRVLLLSKGLPPATLRALLTAASGETVDVPTPEPGLFTLDIEPVD